MAIFLAERHEHPRHQREVEGHVALVAVAEVRADVGRPLVGFGQEHAPAVAGVELPPDPFQNRVRLRQVLVDGAFALDQIWDGVEPQGIHSQVEPEAHDSEDLGDHLGIVEIQVWLVREEAVPVVLAGDWVERPVRLLRVGEDDPRACVLRVRVAPHVVVALGRVFRRPARPLKPRMRVRRVIDDELGEHPDVQRVRGLDELSEVVQRPVDRIDRRVIRDVVPVVAER